MKVTNYLSILLLIATISTACKKDKIEYENDFEKSYRNWVNFKTTSGNSYIYQVSTSSWTNFQTFTTIMVSNGQVTGRTYMSRSTNPPSAAVTIHEQWEEGQNTLNTHQNAAATLTLDEIYDRAKTDWLKKRSDADFYFEAKNDGMISSCGFVPDGCQDDCFTGITIDFIRKLD
ncbi:MAG TPA: hypothetical protein VK541_19045 [Pedobacter sp.]|uniref:hypothetical protein n=1 Tax=Pedobacter sp. TaxID=1411316 RepID=UPI002CFE9657|nr:hypothetical protein [Pedobacter sp.]HMI04596.1 hypothetical protein [Pedobacter sp.]